jgi:iron complex outermembrane receptor protein
MSRIKSTFLATGALLLWAAPAAPQQPAGTPARSVGALEGVVVDAASRAPIAGATVRIRELGRGETSHADGAFHFDRIAPGGYTLVAERIGYATVERRVQVAEGDSASLTLALTPSALQLGGIVVTGTGGARGAGETYRPTTTLGGAELRRRLGTTVTATLAGEPGVAQRYNGPGASQPVIRGLGGDRVLVLEDGERTGDIAGSAADHGVMVEPLTAERMEVVRGPASLLYGSNALGGVVNVIREEVPRSLSDRLTGGVSVQGESVSRGVASGGSVLGAAGPWALRGELAGRRAGDTRTPLGELPSTELRSRSAALGASRVGSDGFAGAAVRDYAMRYGVPGTFGGATIPGAHEGGVAIEVHRTAARAEAARLRRWGPFSSVEADANLVRFRHREMERTAEGGEFVGTTFRQHLGTVNLVARHAHEGGLRSQGAVGVWGYGKDLEVGGLTSGSRSSRQWSLAGFAYEELARGPFRVELGARYDWTRVAPRDARPVAGVPVGTRDFGAASGSAAAVLLLGSGVQAGARAARSFRTPSVEELFSRGPHLAAYSYEIGNPRLDPETGLGTDLFLRVSRAGLEGEVTVYRNAIDNFIYYAPTGSLDPRFGRYPVYQARGDDAVFTGTEASLRWEPVRGWALEATGSTVRADRDGAGGREPLPAIPPAQGRLRVRRDVPRWFAEVGVEGAAAQDRVGEFEEPTAAWLLLNAGAGFRWESGGRLHSVTLQGDNLTDAVWRDHLSRIKELAPQPGINLRLLYRLDF